MREKISRIPTKSLFKLLNTTVGGEVMSYIKNRATLLSHGNVNLRRDTLDIIDHALLMSDPYFQVKKLVSLQGNRLKVGQLEYNLDQYGRIFVLGAGKATYPIAKALEEILGGNRIWCNNL